MGRLLVAAGARGLRVVDLGDTDEELRQRLVADVPGAEYVESEDLRPWLDAIAGAVDGEPLAAELPLDPHGTPYQRRVWAALTEIPRGQTCTYADLAERIGAPGSARAVGGAVARNPLALLVPCHRVVREDGSLGGYRWGVARKKAILEHEQRRII